MAGGHCTLLYKYHYKAIGHHIFNIVNNILTTQCKVKPPQSGNCSLDPETVAMCRAYLYGDPVIMLLSRSHPCCEVVRALDPSEASVCLCPLIEPVAKANRVRLEMAGLNMLLTVCRVQGPINVECA
ncbi:hypothetical protein ACOSQ4_001227 [Xanthoceras sorbifolium]